MEHFCQFDHGLDEECSKPATIRCFGMWLCAEHYDWHCRFMRELRLNPDEYPEGEPDDC